MHRVLAALGLAVAVPVALAAPALAKPPAPAKASVSSELRQYDGFEAKVTYLCTDREDDYGTINIILQQPGVGGVSVVAYAQKKADCDGKEREESINITVADGALRADRRLQLRTDLFANGRLVASHTSPPVAVNTASPTPTPSAAETPSADPTTSASETPETDGPSADPTTSASETPETETPETETPSASPTADQ